MNQESLWAPWRLEYVQGHHKDHATEIPKPRQWRSGADQDCFLCRAAAVDLESLQELGIVDRTSHSVVVINRFPYSNGHLLIAPLDHKAALTELTEDQLVDLQHCLIRWQKIIESCMQAQGFNIGLNLGRLAGAGLPGHLHWHLVPRWAGDVNFMPTIAGTKVLPQSLESLWEQLSEHKKQHSQKSH